MGLCIYVRGRGLGTWCDCVFKCGSDGEGEEIVCAKLKGKIIGEKRKGIPVYWQRRFDVNPYFSKGMNKSEDQDE